MVYGDSTGNIVCVIMARTSENGMESEERVPGSHSDANNDTMYLLIPPHTSPAMYLSTLLGHHTTTTTRTTHWLIHTLTNRTENLKIRYIITT